MVQRYVAGSMAVGVRCLKCWTALPHPKAGLVHLSRCLRHSGLVITAVSESRVWLMILPR